MTEKTGWLVNDCLTCIPGTTTFWHNLLEWIPQLIDKTNGYTSFSVLNTNIENQYNEAIIKPSYIIRNGTYFPKLNIPIKQISLIQDIQIYNPIQLDVINNSEIVVFNTEYVYNKYKNIINNCNIKICPLGIDFNFFKPDNIYHKDVLPNSILFIGSSTNYPKGFNIMLDIMINMPNQNFCLIMKDNYSIHNLPLNIQNRVKIFNRIDQETVCKIINTCICAVCTSYEETQHLSGIECGACNIPIIAREVGIYFDCKNNKDWGLIADDTNFIEKIEYVIKNINDFNPREYFIKKYSTEICRQNWINIIETI
jgi:glycosyltransferase involved in cell wall biosynthesis